MPAGNWGRWGDDDERGALNLLTADVIKSAAGSIKDPVKGHAPLSGYLAVWAICAAAALVAAVALWLTPREPVTS